MKLNLNTIDLNEEDKSKEGFTKKEQRKNNKKKIRRMNCE